MIKIKLYFKDSKTGKYYNGDDGLTSNKDNATYRNLNFENDDVQELIRGYKKYDATPEVRDDVNHDNMIPYIEMNVNDATFILDNGWIIRNKAAISDYIKEIHKIEEKIINLIIGKS